MMNSPYRGLTPYTEADSNYFFGRSGEIAAIAANLSAARLTLLYGPSGVGKTSVLRAGVMNALRQRAQANREATGYSEILPVYYSHWQAEPLTGLTRAVNEAVQAYGHKPLVDHPVDHSIDHPVGDPFSSTSSTSSTANIGFVNQLRAWSEESDSDLLLILDQFEEYFIYHPNDGSLNDFDQEIVQALNTPDLRVNFLFSLREDALVRLDRFKDHIAFLFGNRLSVDHLQQQAGYEAVTRPLARFNQEHVTAYQIEPALVDSVLEQVSHGKVRLGKQGSGVNLSGGNAASESNQRIEAPYLQLVLTRLWQHEQAKQSTTLQLASLNELGGAETIVSNYLHDTMSQLQEHEQVIAARFFDRLVTPTGSKIALSLDELTHYAGGDAVTVQQVLDELQDRRLLHNIQTPSGETRYEIFHDVLAKAILDWQSDYQKRQEEEARLIEEQRARAEADRRAREAEERASLEEKARTAAQAQAETERRTGQRLRRLVAIVAALALAALTLAIFSILARREVITQRDVANTARTAAETARLDAETQRIEAEKQRTEADLQRNLAVQAAQQAELLADKESQQRIEAERQRKLADTNRLAGQSFLVNTIPGDRANNLPLLLASEAVRSTWISDSLYITQPYVTADSDTALRIAVNQASPWLGTLPAERHKQAVQWVDLSSDQKWLATAGTDNTARLWEVATGKQLAYFEHPDAVNAVLFLSADQGLVTAAADGTLYFWEIPKELRSKETATQPSSNVRMREARSKYLAHSASISTLARNVDKTLLLSAGGGQVILWDIRNIDAMTQVAHWDGSRAEIRPDGKAVLATTGNEMYLWPVDQSQAGYTLTGHTNTVQWAIFTPDGKGVVSVSDDGTARLWDASNGQPQAIEPLNLPFKARRSAISPNGEWLVVGSEKGEMALWSMKAWNTGRISKDKQEPLRQWTSVNDGAISSLVFDQPGNSIIVADVDSMVRRWQVATARQLPLLAGHFENVSTVAFHPNGKQLASAGSDGFIILWDLVQRTEIKRLAGHIARVRRLQFTADGSRILSSAEDGSARLWDSVSGQQLITITSPAPGGISAQFAPDEKSIFTISTDDVVRLWDAKQSQALLRTVFSPTFDALVFGLSPTEDYLAVASADNNAYLFDVATGQQVITFTGHSKGIRAFAFRPDGKQLATASDDWTVRLWDVASGRQMQVLHGHRARLSNLAYSVDGKRLASTSQDWRVLLWNVEDGRLLNEFVGHGGRVWDARFSPDDKLIATGGDDGTVRLWDAQAVPKPLILDGEAVNGETGHTNMARFSEDGKWVIAAYNRGTLGIWDATTGIELLPRLTAHTRGAVGVDIRPAQASTGTLQLVSGSKDKSIRLWTVSEITPMTMTSSSYEIGKHEDEIYSVLFSHDGTRVVSASKDKTARIWKIRDGQPDPAPLILTADKEGKNGHTKTVTWACFSQDDRLIFTASSDRTIRVWDAQTGKALHLVTGHQGEINMLALSPDGSQLISASNDKSVRIWDTQTWQEIAPPYLHDQAVDTAVLSPDGKLLLTGTKGNLLYLWDIASHRPIRQLEGHSSDIFSAFFSADGLQIVSAADDGEIRIWPARIEDLLAQADALIQRDPPFLTKAERDRFQIGK